MPFSKVFRGLQSLVFFCGFLEAQAERISVLSFNVENLFDAKRDPRSFDLAYLPELEKRSFWHRLRCQTQVRAGKWRRDCLKLDWSEKLVSIKLARLATVIKSANSLRGADIVLLQEVENLEILERLNREHLKNLGYAALLVEGPDPRGIDVAVLTRLKVEAQPRLQAIDYGPEFKDLRGKMRGFLEVLLKTPSGQSLHVTVLHLPSGGHSPKLRARALEFLEIRQAQIPKVHLSLIGGDFNISHSEDAQQGLLKSYSRRWRISHLEGCSRCRGTAYFGGWSFLDQVWMSRASERHGWRMDPKSIRVLDQIPKQSIYAPGGLRPWAFSKTGGISDHWPIYVELTRSL